MSLFSVCGLIVLVMLVLPFWLSFRMFLKFDSLSFLSFGRFLVGLCLVDFLCNS